MESSSGVPKNSLFNWMFGKKEPLNFTSKVEFMDGYRQKTIRYDQRALNAPKWDKEVELVASLEKPYIDANGICSIVKEYNKISKLTKGVHSDITCEVKKDKNSTDGKVAVVRLNNQIFEAKNARGVIKSTCFGGSGADGYNYWGTVRAKIIFSNGNSELMQGYEREWNDRG